RISLLHGALIEPLAVCFHALERSQSKPGDTAVIIGAGPIGLMTALVARYLGLHVVISEMNPIRIEKARQFGLTTVNPKDMDLRQYIFFATDGVGADAIFEVSGSQAGLDTVTELIHPHSRIVLVAAYPHPMQLKLQKLFMGEVNLTMTRNYNHSDFDAAIKMMEAASVNFDALITTILPLDQVQQGMELCGSPSGEVVKVMISCQSHTPATFN
ncbi:MAG: zinc-binding dehydrogenase, partial [Lawsonibacter sp.]